MSLLANYPFFFDGPEYVALAQMPIGEALRMAHPLAHPVSMVLWRMATLALGSSVAALSLISAVFGVVGLMAVSTCVPRERRWIVWAVGALLPLSWLLMTNVGVDTVTASLFTCGAGLLWKRRTWGRVMGATGLLLLSVMNYPGMVVWLPVPIALIWLDRTLSGKQRVWMGLAVATGAMVGVAGLLGVLAVAQVSPLGVTTFGVEQEGTLLAVMHPRGLLQAIYHAMVAYVANYTWVSVIVAAGYAAGWWRRKDWQMLSMVGGMGTLYVVSLVPWHSGPYGRLGALLIYPLILLYARLPRWWAILAIGLLVPSWGKIVWAYQQTPLPLLQQELVTRSNCEDKQLVLSEVQRPQLMEAYPTAWYVGPANWQEIAGELVTRQAVCVSQQALDYPYRQYEGQSPYPLSGRRGKRGFIAAGVKEEQLLVVGADPKHPELTLYEWTQ